MGRSAAVVRSTATRTRPTFRIGGSPPTMVRRHPHLGRRHLPPEVAANSGQTVAIAATTTPVGATSLLQIAKFAPEASTPAPLHHRAGDAPAASTPVRAARIARTIHATGATRISRAARQSQGNGELW